MEHWGLTDLGASPKGPSMWEVFNEQKLSLLRLSIRCVIEHRSMPAPAQEAPNHHLEEGKRKLVAKLHLLKAQVIALSSSLVRSLWVSLVF